MFWKCGGAECHRPLCLNKKVWEQHAKAAFEDESVCFVSWKKKSHGTYFHFFFHFFDSYFFPCKVQKYCFFFTCRLRCITIEHIPAFIHFWHKLLAFDINSETHSQWSCFYFRYNSIERRDFKVPSDQRFPFPHGPHKVFIFLGKMTMLTLDRDTSFSSSPSLTQHDNIKGQGWGQLRLSPQNALHPGLGPSAVNNQTEVVRPHGAK